MLKRERITVAILVIVILVLAFIALVTFAGGVYALFSDPSIEQRAYKGEFVGGYLGGFVGTLSLAVVVLFSYLQIKQQLKFFSQQQNQTERFFFLQNFRDGIDLIAQWDIKEPGCAQAMRILDYFSRTALLRDDDELLLMLNTVIAGEIRRNLEGKNTSFRRDSYPHAAEALEKIKEIREREMRVKRGGR